MTTIDFVSMQIQQNFEGNTEQINRKNICNHEQIDRCKIWSHKRKTISNNWRN